MRRRAFVVLGLAVLCLALAGSGGAFTTVVGPDVNITRLAGNQAEATIALDPTNSQRLFEASNPGTTAFRSTDGGATWTRVTWNRSGTILASGADVTGLGTVGAFTAADDAPNSNAVGGQFGDIAVGPGGEVMVT